MLRESVPSPGYFPTVTTRASGVRPVCSPLAGIDVTGTADHPRRFAAAIANFAKEPIRILKQDTTSQRGYFHPVAHGLRASDTTCV